MHPKQLQAYLDRQGMTSHELSDVLGLSSSAVNHWVKGIRRVPEWFIRVACYFEDYGLDIRELRDDDNK